MNRYVVGWESIDDSQSFEYADAKEAKRFLRDALRWGMDDVGDVALGDQMLALAGEIDVTLSSTAEIDKTLGGTTYFFRRQAVFITPDFKGF